MRKGRPIHSQIRQNIVEILFYLGKGHGYEIYKNYIAVFPKVTIRSIYYQLIKGEELGLFRIDRVVKEKGNFSWGPEAEKKYYVLGQNAKPQADERIRKHLLKLSKKS